ncbi:MAG TPA: adenosylcobinamide-phosphate synthase CbiB [Candidatus Baltobacteraceae bacterium]|jgi:adenosylcobinamide-phosphate synthase|nr:adenosylcobinamide-phosphate synthase CbiB [Candidatus Baltobacteraceae bacterium]
MERERLLLLALAVDVAIGDPAVLPHPVRAIGRAVEFGEPLSRRCFPATPWGERCAGAALTIAIVGGTWLGTRLLLRTTYRLDARIGGFIDGSLAASSLATRSLLEHIQAVRTPLERGDYAEARAQVAKIVGRDTAQLNASEISRATIETLAESTCDGIIAPLFFLALGGTPLALAFKAVNTLDSMIAHRNERYRDFGFAAAKLDDAANFLPARISALMITLAAELLSERASEARRIRRRDAALHPSPNSGQSEAAMAGALGVRLGGTNAYDGISEHRAILGADYPPPSPAHIAQAVNHTLIATVLSAIAAVGLAFITRRRL